MKSIKFFSSLVLITTTLFFTASCNKKEGCTDPAATNYDPDAEKDAGCEYADMFSLEMHFHSYVNGDLLELGNTYDINGVATQLDLVRMYVSNIRLVDSAGNETAAEGKVLLVQTEPDEYEIGELPAGHYTKIRFDVGLDSATNHSDPATYNSDDPLSFQTPSMNWGWTEGYIFLMVNGEVDTDADGTPDTSLQGHLGTDDYLAHVEINYDLTAADASTGIIHLVINWADLFDGIDLATDHITHVMDNVPMADAMLANIPGMISKEE